MSLLDDLVNDISLKIKNNEKLIFEENMFYNLYMDNLKTITFCDNNRNINVNEVFDVIQQELLNTKSYIIKLIFSNEKNIYISFKDLTKIEYFKNMIDDYVFDNNCILPIVLCKEIDNYNVMIDILNYVTYNTYKKEITTFKYLYDTIIIFDYIGLLCYNTLKIIIDNSILVIKDFIGNTYDAFKRITDILKNHDLTLISQYVMILWKNIIDLDDNVDKIITLPIFKNVIIYHMDSIHYITKHKKYQCFIKLLDKVNYTNIKVDTRQYNYSNYNHCKNLINEYGKMINIAKYESYIKFTYIIDPLLEENTLESYKIIYDAVNYENSKNIKTMMHYLCDNVDKIGEAIFNFDILIFDMEIQLFLMIKYNKIEYITSVTENILLNPYIRDLQKLMDYICKCNNIASLPSPVISPITKYHPCDNNYGSFLNFLQILCYLPLQYKLWTYVVSIYDINKETNSIITLQANKTNLIKNGISILVNKKNNEKYNVISVKNMEICYDKGYAFINIKINSLENINVGDNIYI